jgi:heptosyltransferase II
VPLAWVPTRRRRLMLAGLSMLASTPRPWRRWDSRSGRDGGSVRRILVVELWNIGDVLLAMPFLAQLRELFPAARTTLLAHAHARELLEGTGLVDEIIPADLAWGEKQSIRSPAPRGWLELLRVCRQLRARKFDLAFHARLHIREHAILALSGARRRVGYSFGTRDRVLTDAVAIEDTGRHKVVDWLRLLAPFGGPIEISSPRLCVSASERAWADEYLSARGISSADLVIGIHPGASVPEKRWPLDCFREVAGVLAGRRGNRVLAFSDPAGYGVSLVNLQGVATAQVGLRELIALIERCSVLICNDSGPMHIAGALGVPTVAIFGSGVSQWFAPLGHGHEILSPDTDPLASDDAEHSPGPYDVDRISAERVLKAVEQVLERANGGAHSGSVG